MLSFVFTRIGWRKCRFAMLGLIGLISNCYLVFGITSVYTLYRLCLTGPLKTPDIEINNL